MEKSIEIDINKDDCYKLAESIFMEISGLDNSKAGANFAKMRKDAEFIRKQIEGLVNFKVACNYYDEVHLDGADATIAGEVFNCKAFQQIDSQSVKGAFLYAISSGDFSLEGEPTIKQVYADLWGTALIDAARAIFTRKLEKTALLSDSFGPGFYGMDLSHMKKIAKLMDFERFALGVNNSSVIIPHKSCAGIYFHVTEKYDYLPSSCKSCLGSHVNCSLCHEQGVGGNV